MADTLRKHSHGGDSDEIGEEDMAEVDIEEIEE
jgi:hypothetical protein